MDQLSLQNRMQRNLKNAASVLIRSSKYDNETNEKIQAAYDAGEYQKVLDLAAEQDVPGREALDSKIKMIPNPNFKSSVNREEIQDEVLGKLIDAMIGRMDGTQIDRYLEKQGEEDERLRFGKMHEAEEREPRYIFQVEGVDGDFKSAAKAIAAYQEKHCDAREVCRNIRNAGFYAGFKRNPKYLNLDSPPEEVVQAIPKPPELPEELQEEAPEIRRIGLEDLKDRGE